jgi:hypothetical protein
MPIPSPPPGDLEFLAARSRELHGHKYVLPVAAWILQAGREVIGVRDVMIGLGGQVDRPRIIESLVKLAEFGALGELPRPSQRNSPRLFERVPSPYWTLVERYLAQAREIGEVSR